MKIMTTDKKRFHTVDNMLVDKCTDKIYTLQNNEEATELAFVMNEQEMFIDFFKQDRKYLHEILEKEEKLNDVLTRKADKLEELLMLKKIQKS